MNHKHLLFLLLAGMPLGMAAQQPEKSIVAIDYEGQQQVFLLKHRPRLTFRTSNGKPAFVVQDTQNATMAGVRTCVFSETVTDNRETTADSKTEAGKAKKFVRNSILYIERNGIRYNVQGQRITDN